MTHFLQEILINLVLLFGVLFMAIGCAFLITTAIAAVIENYKD